MSPDRAKHISKFLSLVLRHEPQRISIVLDEEGWAAIDAVLSGAASAGVRFSRDELEWVVAENDKQRFSIDGDRIRANQGHSVAVDLGLPPVIPPDLLYHGTVERFSESIRRTGLAKGKRQHVHLSADIATATKVGERRGKPIVLVVQSGAMHSAGHQFFISANGVWLTDHVPAGYLSWPSKK